ncbi:MAG: PhoH family protein [Spirochaetales bacterium]|nr:PhoH family protein [Spirochaetales bacterium]
MEIEVLSHGNEIILNSEDHVKQEIFKTIVDKLIEHFHIGHTPDPQLVLTLFESITNTGDANTNLLKDLHISLPKSSKVFPRNHNQALYIEGMFKKDIIFAVGPAGTGKTYLAIAHALKEILEKKKRKLVLTRPVVEAGESLGFLPGDLNQKISPYLRPLYDAIDSLIPFNVIKKLEENRVIEIAPLAYMRGRSLKNSYILLDEAQNTTKEQMKMFLTRLGEGSKAIITGDITQIDLPSRKKSGLVHSLEILKDLDDIHFSFFEAKDIVRSPIVKAIVNAYEAEENN